MYALCIGSAQRLEASAYDWFQYSGKPIIAGSAKLEKGSTFGVRKSNDGTSIMMIQAGLDEFELPLTVAHKIAKHVEAL